VADDRALLRNLQMFAKEEEDQDCLHLIFVTSDASTLSILKRSSTIQRESAFEEGKITDEDAIKNLVSEGAPVERVANAVSTITGSRFTLLKEYKRQYPFMSDNNIHDTKFSSIDTALVEVNLYCSHSLFKLLFDKCPVHSSHFFDLEISIDCRENLVMFNILLKSNNQFHFLYEKPFHFSLPFQIPFLRAVLIMANETFKRKHFSDGVCCRFISSRNAAVPSVSYAVSWAGAMRPTSLSRTCRRNGRQRC
jgi:hypothetical protein